MSVLYWIHFTSRLINVTIDTPETCNCDVYQNVTFLENDNDIIWKFYDLFYSWNTLKLKTSYINNK